MKKNLTLILAIAAVIFGISGLIGPGCATRFDVAGPYATNTFLGHMDITLVESKAAILDFVTWEDLNHDTLVKTPTGLAVAVSANTIRSNAPLWFTNASSLRAVYVTVFTPQSSNAFLSAVTSIQSSAQTSKLLTRTVH